MQRSALPGLPTQRHDDEATAVDVVVHAKDLAKRYRNQIAVEAVTLDIRPGTILGVIGPSGSGKTTAVRLLTGIIVPSSGEVEVLGTRPRDFAAEHRTRIGYMPQLNVLYPQLSLWENLNFVASMYGVPLRRGERLRRVLELVELDHDAKKLLRDASGGMQRRLALAATLVHEPELIFLDEPTAGIDPVLRRKFWDHFAQLKRGGRTLLVTTQYVGEAAYCDLVAVLAGNRLLTVDTPEGLHRRAYGGELVDVVAMHALEEPLLTALRDVEGVISLERTGTERRALRLLVSDAGAAIPRVSRLLDSHNVAVESIERHVPPFDDVFVALVERLSGPRPARAAGRRRRRVR